MHTELYEKIIKNNWYPDVWNKTMCRNAVVKGKLTAEEYKLITGEEY